MKSITFMSDWKFKEIQDLEPFCKEVHHELRGTIIAKEGVESDRVFIIVRGEVEIVKRDLNSCYFNV